MSKLKIKPWGNKIQLDFPTTKAGVLQVTTGASIQEMGTVLAYGPQCAGTKIGLKMLIKTWDVDIITIENEFYYFISEDSRAICAIVDK